MESTGSLHRLRKSDLTLTELQRLDMELRKRGRSRDTLWALWGLLSYFGAHRYYVGDNGYATAMFATSFVPMIGIAIQFMFLPADSVTAGVLFWVFVFWLGASVLWSWIDAFFVNGRVERFNDEAETQIIAEIAAERSRSRQHA
ncbi:hypothetical protein DRQ53_01765 [bacterium]|nr:MAG: hypothetical protein DRQ53_01765 [bacterium]